ncbi:hypothetical protein D9M68_821320 [compost metagenome]
MQNFQNVRGAHLSRRKLTNDWLDIGGEGVFPLLGVLHVLPAGPVRCDVVGSGILEGHGLGGSGPLAGAQGFSFGVTGGQWIGAGQQLCALSAGFQAGGFQAHLRKTA